MLQIIHQSMAINGNQWQSMAIRSAPRARWPRNARDHPPHLMREAIRGHQKPSELVGHAVLEIIHHTRYAMELHAQLHLGVIEPFARFEHERDPIPAWVVHMQHSSGEGLGARALVLNALIFGVPAVPAMDRGAPIIAGRQSLMREPIIAGRQSLMREPISGHPWQFVVVRANQWQSMVINGNQWQSVAVRANQWQSEAISGSPCQSMAIRGNQRTGR